ncbi:hypothetical protein [uncultured Corynebacterium sp.]|uniref:hypothetical protein n=1 Tax=uncultured Corynebacterium sp. TaxID=159447 RepID=UPI00260AD11C|nr:hypothetical protein [uncultured Corynebacterium sp.]
MNTFRAVCEKTTIPVILAAALPITILVQQNQCFLVTGGAFVAVEWVVLLTLVISKLVFFACMLCIGLVADLWAWILIFPIGLVAIFSDARRLRAR